jgi:sterol desaturase/sphingolipid hydroxylase (fatty acid hydroxylase superfamily)
MQDIIHTLIFIIAAGSVFLAIIVAEYIWCRANGLRDVYCFKETIANVAMGGSYKIADGIAIALFVQLFFDWVQQFGMQYVPDDGVWSVVLIVLVADLGWFVLHYLTHKVRWGWAAHVTHHSSTRMNYSTALRQNFTMPFNGVLMLQWVPIALIGFDKTWATVAIELNLAYQFFLHTERFSPLDRFGAVLNTPSHHRVHHGNQNRQIDTNFGGVLIIWDRLFGTFVPESEAGAICYGIRERQPRSLNPLHLMTHEWIDMFKDAWRYRDPRVFIMGPNWAPEIKEREPNKPAHREMKSSSHSIADNR